MKINQEIPVMLPDIPESRPRLFINTETRNLPRKTAAGSYYGQMLSARVLHDARILLKERPVRRIMEGMRLLGVSRNVLYRVNTLAMAYLLTGKPVFAARTAQEMCAAAEFSDWNPSHFLDVAEMTLALAIGYDWLYTTLQPSEREKIRNAILEKGLKPSFQGKPWWITGKNNWNQVCHVGMVAGALAIADSEPELAKKTITRAIRNVPGSMKSSFSPNGAYPEGPMYWAYGTEFTVLLLALLDGAFGGDFGLSDIPGFSATGDFMTAATAPSGFLFNYADCGRKSDPSFAMHWLIQRFQRPDWFSKQERNALIQETKRRPATLKRAQNRLLPLSLLYLPDHSEPRMENRKLFFYSGSSAAVPVAICRTGWRKQDAYLGIKGGSPSGSHGHMDGGSFVYETDGVRWAVDLGSENYHKIESQGIDLWNNSQNSERWQIFRIGPESHNILRINDAPQSVDGKAVFTKCTPTRCVMNLTSLYRNSAGKVLRELELCPDHSLRITDTLAGLQPGARIRWQLCTQAEPSGCATLCLRSRNRELLLQKNCGQGWKITPAEDLMHTFDSPNKGIRIVSFETCAPPNGKQTIVVEFLPVKKGKR